MAARRPYRMTPARKAAIRKAQIASARKRKGTGRAKPLSVRRRAAQANAGGVKRRATAQKSAARRTSAAQNKKRNLRKIAVASAVAAGVGASAAYTYKNRERMIVQPMAQRRFVKIEQRAKGRKLTKAEKTAVKQKEMIQHKSRSNDAARMYKEARAMAKQAAEQGQSLNPRSKNYFYAGTRLETIHIDDGVKRNGKYGTNAGRFMFEMYRKDVHTRAENRLRRIKGQKAGFSYKSGKQKRVDEKGRVRRMNW